MSKFNVGDVVIRINQNNGDRGAKVGQVAVVVDTGDHGNVLVKYPGHHQNPYEAQEGETWFVANTALYEPKFFVGDRVRVARKYDGIATWYPGMDATIDQEGRIGEVYTFADGTITYRVDLANDWWWYHPQSLDLIKAAPEPEQFEAQNNYLES